jgi:hypothetical protein
MTSVAELAGMKGGDNKDSLQDPLSGSLYAKEQEM